MRVLSPYEYQCKLAEEAKCNDGDKKDYSKCTGLNTIGRIGKVMGTGLAGMAVGGFGTLALAHGVNKLLGDKPLPGYVVVPASTMLGMIMGPIITESQNTQVRKMKDAVEDYKKYRALKRQES